MGTTRKHEPGAQFKRSLQAGGGDETKSRGKATHEPLYPLA